MTVTVEWSGGSLQPAGRRSFARLVVGCPATDMLLLCEGLVLEEFGSPLTKQLSLPAPKGAWQGVVGLLRDAVHWCMWHQVPEILVQLGAASPPPVDIDCRHQHRVIAPSDLGAAYQSAACESFLA